MFKKKPTVRICPSSDSFATQHEERSPHTDSRQIKNLAPLRSSDRRKIADQIIKDYQISVPSNAPAESDPASNPTSSSLTTIRNAILPDNSLSARFTTTAGPHLSEVQGTVYVGTHPGSEERVLWFKLETGPGSDGRYYPTVYTLWNNPNIVPLLHTPEFVMKKLHDGADLMTPGLANDPPFPERAVKGAVVAVASLDRHTVPLFVGVCEIDIAGLGEVQGTKGHAVRGLQWEGDEIWAWSSSSRPGQPAPAYLEGWDDEIEEDDEGEKQEGEDADHVNEGVDKLALDGGKAEGDGDESLGESPEQQPEEAPVEEKEPTTKEIDDAFVNAFLYALYKLKQDNPTLPNHGLSLPIQPSALIANLTTPYLPIHSPQQAQYYNIKKTSWKNVKKFIKHLHKLQLVLAKDRSGQETVILDVDFDDRLVKEFVPYKLPKSAGENKGKKQQAAPASKNPAAPESDPSVGQTLTVQALYRPTQKLTPTIFPALSATNPDNYYKYSDVSNHLDQYLQAQSPPIISPQNRRIISLNPFLANTVFASSSGEDKSTLARGMTTRDGLLKRLVEDHSFLAPHHAILRAGQTISDVKPKAGAAPKAYVTMERRTGSKTVTKVHNLEVFGIIPTLLAEELQKKCASSTSVTQATSAPKGVMEVLVQGDQRRALETALTRRGLKTQWIEVVDKTKKKK